MSKETFSRLASMIGATTSINGVITEIEAAFDNTLSRNGSSPNQMSANLDMNSNRILNLPQPLVGTEPVRLQDLASFIADVSDIIWVWQVKKALQSLGHYYTIDNAIEVGPSNTTWITWTSGTITYVDDSLYNLIESTISMTVANQVYALARGMLP